MTAWLRKIGKLYRWYPPRRWVFWPLYRHFRRTRRWSMPLSNLAVWAVSAALHVLVCLPSGSVVACLVIGSVFLFLGFVSTLVVLLAKKPARVRAARTK